MSTTYSVLLLGAGLIGGQLALDLQAKSDFNLTVYIRSAAQAKVLSELGIKSIVGELDHKEKIMTAVKANDIIINTADSTDLKSAQFTMDALKENPSMKNGKPKIFLHTSGGAIYGSNFHPDQDPDTEWRDDDMKQFDLLNPKAPRRGTDLLLWKEAEGFTDKFKLAILVPGTAFGVGKGPFNKTSVQVPMMLQQAIKNRYVSQGLEGQTVLSPIHNDDLVAAYFTLIYALLDNKVDLSTNHYFNVTANSDYIWGQITPKIAEALYKRGLVDSTTVRNNEGIFGPGPDFYGYLRFTAVRLRELGWEPKGAGYEIPESMDQEIEEYLRSEKAKAN